MRSVLAEQLVDWIVEIQAEVGCRVESFFHQGAGEAGGIADIGFEDHVAQDAYFLGLLGLLLGQKKFVERAVHAGKFAQLVGGDKVHGIESGVQNFQAAEITVIVREILQKSCGDFGALRAAAGSNLGYRRV